MISPILSVVLFSTLFFIPSQLPVLRSLTPLFSSSPRTTLAFPTRQLDGLRFWSVFIYFILRSLARRVGLVGSAKFERKAGGGEDEFALSGEEISLRMPCHITKKDVELYYTASLGQGWQKRDIRPSVTEDIGHLQVFLSAMTEPAMLLLLGKWNCQIDPVGSVNVRNHFELVNAASAVVSLEQEINATRKEGERGDLEATARMGKAVKRVRRGWEIAIVVELVSISKKDVLYRQTFTMLQFASSQATPKAPSTSAQAGASTKSSTSVPATEATVTKIQIAEDEPSVWANLSKDYNPIHLSSIAAKLFGFKAKIAHGNHVVAKALPWRSESRGTGDSTPSNHMFVEFQRPTFVPARLDVNQEAEVGKETRINVESKGKVSVAIRY